MLVSREQTEPTLVLLLPCQHDLCCPLVGDQEVGSQDQRLADLCTFTQYGEFNEARCRYRELTNHGDGGQVVFLLTSFEEI